MSSVLFLCSGLMFFFREEFLDWSDSHLYIQYVGKLAARLGVPCTCDDLSEGGDDTMSTMVSGLTKSFEAFAMMCVSIPLPPSQSQ